MKDILYFFSDMNAFSIALRLLLAMLLGSLVGVERANKRYAAGIRTFALVCMGTVSIGNIRIPCGHRQNPGTAFVRNRIPRCGYDYRYGQAAGQRPYDRCGTLGHRSDGNCNRRRVHMGGAGMFRADDYNDVFHVLHDKTCGKSYENHGNVHRTGAKSR